MLQAGRLLVFLAALSSPLAIQASVAEEPHGSRPPPAPQVRSDDRSVQGFHRDFRDGNIRHAPDHGHGAGTWHGDHRFHGGHGGFLLFYPGPIYPYPDYYMSPPLYEAPQVPGYWYYCDDPPGYYPYVDECHRPWKAVAPGEAPPE